MAKSVRRTIALSPLTPAPVMAEVFAERFASAAPTAEEAKPLRKKKAKRVAEKPATEAEQAPARPSGKKPAKKLAKKPAKKTHTKPIKAESRTAADQLVKARKTRAP